MRCKFDEKSSHRHRTAAVLGSLVQVKGCNECDSVSMNWTGCGESIALHP